MKKVFSLITLFILSFNVFAQNCEQIDIITNLKNSYSLCNGNVTIPLTILNEGVFNNVDWIIGNEFQNGTDVNFTLNQIGF